VISEKPKWLQPSVSMAKQFPDVLVARRGLAVQQLGERVLEHVRPFGRQQAPAAAQDAAAGLAHHHVVRFERVVAVDFHARQDRHFPAQAALKDLGAKSMHLPQIAGLEFASCCDVDLQCHFVLPVF